MLNLPHCDDLRAKFIQINIHKVGLFKTVIYLPGVELTTSCDMLHYDLYIYSRSISYDMG